MANEGHLAILKYGVSVWNKWRRDNRIAIPDLRGADLRGAVLIGADLRNADLRLTDFSDADLSKADLSGSNLSNSFLFRVTLHRANVCQALLRWTIFVDVDLSQVDGLVSVRHGGPSYVDIFTHQISQGKIPQAFFRKAGMLDIS